jgi:hypothetical protein
MNVGPSRVIPNRSNRKKLFRFNKRLYKLRWRIESAFNRLNASQRATTYWRETAWPLSAWPPPRYGEFNESGP